MRLPFSLRRIGGLKRFVLLISGVLVVVYLLQTLLLNSTPGQRLSVNTQKPKSVSGSEDGTSRVFTATVPLASQELGCNAVVLCGNSELTFNLSSSLSDSIRPQACINNLLIFSNNKIAKGINIVVIDETQKAVQDIKYFDFVANDREFVSYMVHVPDSRIILLTSWGDFAGKLSPEGKDILKKYGSSLADYLKAGQSFVMVGQKGLTNGMALEKAGFVSPQDTDGNVVLKGCVKIPLGKLTPVTFANQRGDPPEIQMPQVVRDVIYGAELVHCGRRDPCAASDVAVSVYSGKDKDDEPKICVNGRFVISRNLNKAGRGLNVVILNATAKEVLRVGHFDTYQEDSSTLEIFLEDLIPGEVIVVVSFDEASTRLSSMAKQIFYELGSGLVQNLKFRASWYFIGQKGINGFSPFEELNYAQGSDWARPVDKRLCIPPLLSGQKIRPDPTVHSRNDAKRHFCSKYDGYEDFCEESHLDDSLTPVPLFNKLLPTDHAIFSVPILVIAGLAHNSLRLCLETIIRQPGLNVSNVLVTYDENYGESQALAQLFGFKCVSVPASSSYNVQVMKSLAILWEQFPRAEAAIIIEEDLMLTSDFLFFMAQTLPLLLADETVLSVSAWNENGFSGTSTMPNIAYRVEGFPGLGFMFRRSTYLELIKKDETACCSKRAWDGWLTSEQRVIHAPYMIVPDVSRVYRRHADGLGILEARVYDLFKRPRMYNIATDPVLENVLELSNKMYDSSLRKLLTKAKMLSYDKFAAGNNCDRTNLESIFAPSAQNNVYAIEYSQKSLKDYNALMPLLSCFGLYHSPNEPPRGIYKDLLRFSISKSHCFLIGSKSPLNVNTSGAVKDNDNNNAHPKAHSHEPAGVKLGAKE